MRLVTATWYRGTIFYLQENWIRIWFQLPRKETKMWVFLFECGTEMDIFISRQKVLTNYGQRKPEELFWRRLWMNGSTSTTENQQWRNFCQLWLYLASWMSNLGWKNYWRKILPEIFQKIKQKSYYWNSLFEFCFDTKQDKESNKYHWFLFSEGMITKQNKKVKNS